MATCIPAPACVAALREATALSPNRRKTSDGICGDPAHQGTVSDHNPDASGYAHAWDLSHDPTNGIHCGILSEIIKSNRDHRIKYIIWNRRIWNPSISPDWRSYNGSNPHTSHMHVSIISSPATRNDTSSWFQIHGGPIPMPDDPNIPNLKDIKFFETVVGEDRIPDSPTFGQIKCLGYYFVSSIGEVHSWGPGAPFYGRSEVPS